MEPSVLARQHPTLKTKAGENAGLQVAKTILQVRPWHRYAVLECGIDAPGQARRQARMVKPNLVVVTRVARSHTRSLGDLDAIAREKSEFVRGLGASDHVVLNGDDPRVRDMSHVTKAKTVFFGTDAGLDVWADQLSSKWPERFSCRVHYGKANRTVGTQLVGTHWYSSVLSAIAAGVTFGVPFADAVAAVATVEPFISRLEPVKLDCGATILRDEKDGSIDTYEAAFRVLNEATARRKVAVIGDCTDMKGSSRQRFRYLGKQIAKFAELAIFVGEHGHHGVQAAIQSGMHEEGACSFIDVKSAAEFLQSQLGAGDLVLLKGRKSRRPQPVRLPSPASNFEYRTGVSLSPTRRFSRIGSSPHKSNSDHPQEQS